MKDKAVEVVWKALDKFNIELPSWDFANTGTRFGKFCNLRPRQPSKKSSAMPHRFTLLPELADSGPARSMDLPKA